MHRSTLARTRPLIAALLCCVAAQALALDAKEKRIVRAVDARQAQALGLLAETVDIDSATENHAGVRKVGDVLARELAKLGFETRWVDVPAEVGRAGHLVAVHRGTKGERLLLIGHLDTVLEGERFRRDGNRAYGSGTADMKGGNVIIVEALRALHAAGALQDRQVTVVFTGDEEDPGAPVELSRQALLAAGEQSDIALGFEGGLPGVAVIGRRGIGTWRLQVTGRQAHSSGIFRESQGYGAIFEAARILDRFREELREPNLTYNPSVILGGTTVTYDEASKGGTALGKTNVIPREVRVTGDLRFLSSEQFDAAREKMTAIVAENLPRNERRRSASSRNTRRWRRPTPICACSPCSMPSAAISARDRSLRRIPRSAVRVTSRSSAAAGSRVSTASVRWVTTCTRPASLPRSIRC